jgi:hypothetical protein
MARAQTPLRVKIDALVVRRKRVEASLDHRLGLWAAAGCLLVLAVLASPAAAAITVSADFDCGAIDLSASVQTGTGFVLTPRSFPSPEWTGTQWWWYARLDGVLDKAPTLKVPYNDAFQTYGGSERFVYSYDQVNWQFFPTLGYDSQYLRFSPAAKFTQDHVYVAYGLPYTTAMASAHAATVAASPYVKPSVVGSSNLVIGMMPAATDAGRSIPSLPLYGYRIGDDSAAAPKKKVVLMAGNHSGEMTGNYTLQGMVDWLLSDDPQAASLRRAADFYIYPMADPQGRYAGYFRSDPENPSKNHNRYWDNPTGFTDITAIEAAMRADTGGDVDWFMDFHSSGWSDFNALYYHTPMQAVDDYYSSLCFYEPDMLSGTISAPGMAAVWASTAAGLNADVYLTPETGFLAGWQPDRYYQLGADYGRALADTIPEPATAAMLLIGAALALRRRTEVVGHRS